MDQLYREATDQETQDFLNSEFPTRKINWYSENVNGGVIIHGKYLKKRYM
jgi:hypothetical protein